MATRLLVQIRTHFTINLKVSDIFDSPTIVEMAALIEEILLTQTDADRVEVLLTTIEHIDEEDIEDIDENDLERWL